MIARWRVEIPGELHSYVDVRMNYSLGFIIHQSSKWISYVFAPLPPTGAFRCGKWDRLPESHDWNVARRRVEAKIDEFYNEKEEG